MKKNASFKWYVFLGRQILRKTIILSVDGKKKKKNPWANSFNPKCGSHDCQDSGSRLRIALSSQN